MGKIKFTNISPGDRGVRGVDGEVVMIAPGKTASAEVNDGELKDARASGYFQIASGPLDHDESGDDGGSKPADAFDAEAFIGRTLAEISDDDILALSPEQIEAVRVAENDREKPRSGLIERLDAVGA